MTPVMRDETPWLREMLDDDDEEFSPLFSEDETVRREVVPRVIARAQEAVDRQHHGKHRGG